MLIGLLQVYDLSPNSTAFRVKLTSTWITSSILWWSSFQKYVAFSHSKNRCTIVSTVSLHKVHGTGKLYVFFSIRASVVLLRNLYEIVTLIWTPMKQVIHISPFIFLAYWKIRKAVKMSIVFWILKFIVLLPSLNGILYSKMIHWTGNQFSPFVLKPLRTPLCNGSNTVWFIELYQLGHTLKRYKLSLPL